MNALYYWGLAASIVVPVIAGTVVAATGVLKPRTKSSSSMRLERN